MKSRLFLVGMALFGIGALAPFLFQSANQAHAAPGGGTLFGVDGGGGNLLTVDLITGGGTIVGPVFPDVIDDTGFPSLAVHPATGRMYAVEGRGNPILYEVDPATANLTFVGNTGLGFAAVGAMDFRSDGVLFGALNIAGRGGSGPDHLGIVDESTGAVTIIGPFGTCTGVQVPSTGEGSCTIEGMTGIAFDTNGVLWGGHNTWSTAGPPGLYMIDTATGAATYVTQVHDGQGHSLTGGLGSIQYSCDGTLYGGSARSSPTALDGGRLITIDPITGIGAFVGTETAVTNGHSLGGLAFADNCGGPPPEPRSKGFWTHQCSELGFHQVSDAELNMLFGIIEADSPAFQECAPLSCDALTADGPQNDMRLKAEKQAIALRLNVASGRLHETTPVDLSPLSGATMAGEALDEVEATLCDPSAKRSELELAKEIAEALNLGGFDMEIATVPDAIAIIPGESVSIPVVVINMSPFTWSFGISAAGNWPVTLSRTEILDLPPGQIGRVTARVTAPAWASSAMIETMEFSAEDLINTQPLERDTEKPVFVRSVGGGGGQKDLLLLKME